MKAPPGRERCGRSFFQIPTLVKPDFPPVVLAKPAQPSIYPGKTSEREIA